MEPVPDLVPVLERVQPDHAGHGAPGMPAVPSVFPGPCPLDRALRRLGPGRMPGDAAETARNLRFREGGFHSGCPYREVRTVRTRHLRLAVQESPPLQAAEREYSVLLHLQLPGNNPLFDRRRHPFWELMALLFHHLSCHHAPPIWIRHRGDILRWSLDPSR